MGMDVSTKVLVCRKRRHEGNLSECCGCRRMLPRQRFRVRLRGGKPVLRPRCRGCEKPERAASNHKRRTKTRGSFTARDVQNLAYAQGGKCRKCLRSLAVTGYHVDHIVPIARGGLNVVGNLQLLCPRCNLKKGCK